jgi:hypothetical protein
MKCQIFPLFSWFSLIWPQARSFFHLRSVWNANFAGKKFLVSSCAGCSSYPCMYIDIREERFFWGFVCSKSSSTSPFAKKRRMREASHFTSCLIYSINTQSVQTKKINKFTFCYFINCGPLSPATHKKSIKFIRVNIN